MTSQIRDMTRDDRKTILRIMRRAFPIFQQLFFSLTPNVLVYEDDSQIPGAVVLKTFSIPKGQKAGVVYWIFTDPDAQGRGVGQALFEAGLQELEAMGCQTLFAIVEGFNTSSSQLFSRHGFSILPFRDQLQRFGLLGLFKVWWATFHIPDIGHFLWGKPPAQTEDQPGPQFLATLGFNILLSLAALWRSSGFTMPNLTALWALPLAVFLMLETRIILMTLSARKQNLTMRFRMWESGFTLSTFLALTLGYYFPIPGSVYPDEKNWRYKSIIPPYGKIALAGVLPSILLAWGSFLILQFILTSDVLKTALEITLDTTRTFAIFDVVLAFFPFVSFNGRRLWDWQKTVWGILSLSIITLTVLIRLI